VLLTTSGAFLRSFQKMRAVDPGFRPDHVVTAEYQLPLQQYSTNASAQSFNHAVIDRLSSKPGIVAVGISNALPASGGYGQTAYTIEGEPATNWKLKFAMFGITYGDYFRTMSIPLLEGRYFTPDDRSNSPLVVIVSRWPDIPGLVSGPSASGCMLAAHS
jgi:putative ABC transport system permease protein